MLGNSIKLNDQCLASLTYRIASENGGQIEVEDIAKEVFTDDSTHKEQPVKDLVGCTKKFIQEHQWLMKELGK